MIVVFWGDLYVSVDILSFDMRLMGDVGVETSVCEAAFLITTNSKKKESQEKPKFIAVA